MVEHEAWWKPFAGRKEWLMVANFRAMKTIKQTTGIEPFAFLLDESSSITRMEVLMYCLGESFRRATDIKLTLDEFIDGGYLPVYLSQEWIETVAWLDEFLANAFPWAVEIKEMMRINPAAKTNILSQVQAQVPVAKISTSTFAHS